MIKNLRPTQLILGLLVGTTIVVLCTHSSTIHKHTVDRFLATDQAPYSQHPEFDRSLRFSLPDPDFPFEPSHNQRLNRLETPDIWRLPELYNAVDVHGSSAQDEFSSAHSHSHSHLDSDSGSVPTPHSTAVPSDGRLYYDTTVARVKAPPAPVVRQPLLDQHVNGAEKIFLMLKTGQDVMWNRLPIHLLTTLTKFPRFAIYSDYPGSVAGHEVLDILATLPEHWRNEYDEFKQYRKLRDLRLHNFYLPSGQKGSVLDLTGDEKTANQGWMLDRFKNVPMMRHAWETDNTLDWYVFIDGDTYLNAENLVRHLADFNPNEHVYMGHRVSAGKYAFAHGGSGVILSRHSMNFLFGTPEQADKMIDWYGQGRTDLGDLAVALMVVDEFDAKLVHVPGLTGQRPSAFEFDRLQWCEPAIGFHHMGPHDIETFWEYEQSFAARNGRHTPILLADLFYDFLFPFLTETRHSWINQNSRSTHPEPVTDIQECKERCEEDGWCFQYYYNATDSTCSHSPVLSLGKPLDPSAGDITAGWLMDRVQKYRPSCGIPNKLSPGWAVMDRH